MIAYPEKRSVRRLLKRQAEAQKAEDRRAAKLAQKMARQDPRMQDDRRHAERRRDADPATLDERMRAAGITSDRRRGERRQGDRRRR